jgi:formate-dependent nitrite reductase membrane component NrfD
LLLFGLYLIAITLIPSRAAARWPIWVLPFALTLDNLTYGMVGDGDAGSSALAQASWQALASGALALAGLLVAVALPRLLPQLKRRKTSNALAGAALVVAAGLVLMT